MACCITFSANNQSCVNIGGITAITIGGTAVDVRPETSHAEFKYTYNPDAGVGLWEGDIYIDLGKVDSTNIASVNSLAQAGQCDVTMTLFDGATWSVEKAYCLSANAVSGTKMEDGTKVDCTLHVKSPHAPVPSAV